MEECCAVCAEPLEWVGYGVCGHREVCSTCIARLRFVLNDRQCCICKQECPSVFVTKALGDYTKTIENFEILSKQRDLWYENDIQAYFDDEDHYQMIKAMCRLSCSICEQSEHVGKDSVNKGFVFRNLDALRRHLTYAHKVQMCGLCLEGRKIFLCEQKLYTKQQIDKHLSNGDSEVDGNDEERGGFTGHPLCNFCRRRFYGENELYQHMSTDHFTCHICRRLRPGQYDYFRNYDDLEAHFRHEHALCEHPDCLAQKFVVFVSDSELKRHNALAHGGNMSRAQRNAALQIPVSFQYRRPGQDRRGSGPSRRHENYSNGHTRAGQPANVGPPLGREHEAEGSSTPSLGSMNGSQSAVVEDAMPDSSSLQLGTPESPPRNEPARYRAAVSGMGPSSLQVSAFPPLPGSESTPQTSRQRARGAAVSMASLLNAGEGTNTPNIIKQGRFKTPEREPLPPILRSSESQEFPVLGRQRPVEGVTAIRSPAFKDERLIASEISKNRALVSDVSVSEASNGAVPISAEELRMANKTLIESIRLGLKGNDRSFDSFKNISAQFRNGEVNASVYFEHIRDLGLVHLVPELARLCPDPKKQVDLLEVHQSKQTNLLMKDATAKSDKSRKDVSSTKSTAYESSGLRVPNTGEIHDDAAVEELSKDGYRELKGKKAFSTAPSSKIGSTSKDIPVKVLVNARKPLFPSVASESKQSWACHQCTFENNEGSSICVVCGAACLSGKVDDRAQGGKNKKKSVSKFRLGDGSAALVLNSGKKAWQSDA